MGVGEYIVGAVLAVASPFVIRYIVKSISRQIVADLGDSLQDRWKKDIEKAVEPVDARLHSIEKQLSPNGGESLFDKVARIDRAVNGRPGWGEANGTPQGF